MAFKYPGKHGPLLIAEIGGNHEGSFEYAVRLTESAVQTGVDCVKYQLYTGDSLVNALVSPDRNEHFKRFELTVEQHHYLAEICARNQVIYSASIWSSQLLDEFDRHLPFYKVGSGDLTAWPLIEQLAIRGKPIILSTGLATMEEVSASVAVLRAANCAYDGPENLALLQCTSMYPIEESEANIAVMPKYRAAYNVSVGYSDHTESTFALFVAAAMGAEILEFHFTDTRESKTFRDHKVSLTSNEIGELTEKLKRLRNVVGSDEKVPTKSEIDTDHVHSFRRAVFPSRDLAAGHRLSPEDLVCLRPAAGIGSQHFRELLGRKLKAPVNSLQPLDWTMFDV